MTYIKRINNNLTLSEVYNMKEEVESCYFIDAHNLGVDINSKVCIINLKKQESLKDICKDLDIDWHESAKGIRFGRKNE